ncbi:MAG: hypothetical protein ACR2PL_05220 [Dehalococcoidia bacterium]
MVNRRSSSSRNLSIDRPRTKGWHDIDEYDESQSATMPRRPASAQRPNSGQYPKHLATPVGRFLSPQQIESVRAIMRLFLTDDAAKGIPREWQLVCHCCEARKWAAGFVRYGRTILCNDCATEYEISRLRGHTDLVTDFLSKQADPAAG